MAKIIFSTKTYFLTIGFSQALAAEFALRANKLGIEIVNADNFLELKEVAPKILHRAGVFVLAPAKSTSDFESSLSFLRNQKIEYKSVQSNLNIESFLSMHMVALVPRNLLELTVFSANFIFPHIIPNFTFNFSSSSLEENKFKYAIICDLSAKGCTGRVAINFNPDGLKEKIPSFADFTDNKMLMNLQEAANQFLGVVGHNLMLEGIPSRVGLPIIKTKDSMRGVKIYIPTVGVADQNGIFLIKFGFVNMAGGKTFDINSKRFMAPMSNVDFL